MPDRQLASTDERLETPRAAALAGILFAVTRLRAVVLAVGLLLSIGSSPWVVLIFPAWVCAVSLHILVSNLRSRPGLLAIALLETSLLPSVPAALAQDQTVSPTASDAAVEFSDPLTTLPQIFVKNAWTPESYGTDANQNRLTARLIVPRVPSSSLLPFVQLIRPSFSLVTVPSGRGGGTRTEFGDMQLFDLGVIPWPGPKSGWVLGVGPMFVFPTATDRTAGQGAWQLGPAFGAIYKGIPGLLLGCLVQNPISFAYTDSDREPVDTLLFQPLLLAYLGHGFYVKSADSTWARGWRDGSATILPVSLGLGYVLLRDGWPPLNFSVSGEWTAYRANAPTAPQTTLVLGLTAAFPQWRPW